MRVAPSPFTAFQEGTKAKSFSEQNMLQVSRLLQVLLCNRGFGTVKYCLFGIS